MKNTRKRSVRMDGAAHEFKQGLESTEFLEEREDVVEMTLHGPWESSDETITTPDEVHVYRRGYALACHAGSGDVLYRSLADLESDYQIENVKQGD